MRNYRLKNLDRDVEGMLILIEEHNKMIGQYFGPRSGFKCPRLIKELGFALIWFRNAARKDDYDGMEKAANSIRSDMRHALLKVPKAWHKRTHHLHDFIFLFESIHATSEDVLRSLERRNS